MSEPVSKSSASLLDQAGVSDALTLDASAENAWIEVIHKMDAVYADLVRYQVELEEKNAALEEAQQLIRGVLAAMTDVLIVCDIQGRILQVNTAYEALSGRREQDLLLQPVVALFASGSASVVDRFPEKLESDAIVDCEVNLLGREGELVPLAMNCSSRYDHEGRLLGMVLIGRPVGELRRAYDDLRKTHIELQQAQQHLVQSEKLASLGRLVAGVAHELNNPISFVFGNMHALQRYSKRIVEYLDAVDAGCDPQTLSKLRADAKIDRIVADMGSLIDGTLEGAERVSEIVKDLRRYSACQREPVNEFDLTEVVHTAAQWVSKAARTKPRIEFELPEELKVKGRKGHVHQILVNLIQNAVDVMEEQAEPRLRITAEAGSDPVRVQVQDSGPGIPEADLGKVFDPFFTTKPVGKGTGLGLYVSYGLAADIGGNLDVENNPLGGAVFTLTMPREVGERV